MSQVDALFHLLSHAPPRAAEVVKRVALAGQDFPTLAQLYGVDVPRAKILVFRALLDVSSGGVLRVPDEREAAEVEAMLGSEAGSGEGAQARKLWQALSEHREALKARLEQSAAQYTASPDRDRDEWLRRAAIVLVLALTAFFYWQEKTKPKTPLMQRRIVAPQSPP